jgi:hypothetical protein
MKRIITLCFCLISLAASEIVGEEGKAIDGEILSVDWPDKNIITPNTLISRIVIENTGAPTNFNIGFSVQDPNDDWA